MNSNQLLIHRVDSIPDECVEFIWEEKEGGTLSLKYTVKIHRHKTLNTIRDPMLQEISMGIGKERAPCQTVYGSGLPMRVGDNADPAWRQRILINHNSG